MRVITTHYIAPTPHKGARIRAKSGKLSKMYNFPHESRDPHCLVAAWFATDHKFVGNFYRTALSGTSHLFVAIPEGEAIAFLARTQSHSADA